MIPQVSVRPLETGEIPALRELLVDLPLLYPKASEWLDRRLRNLEGIVVAVNQEQLLGVLITTGSGNLLKLSTLFVRSGFRRQEIGRRLVEAVIPEWRDQGKDVFVTVDESLYPALVALLAKYGFRKQQEVPDLYRTGTKEIFLVANQQQLLEASLALKDIAETRLYPRLRTVFF